MTEMYEVKLLKIPVFDQETGDEIGTDEKYHVCSKIIDSENYPCYDETTANELCEYLNTLTSDYNLNKTLPQYTLFKENSIFNNLGEKINDKNSKLNDLQKAIEHELVCEFKYNEKCNEIKLHPDIVKEALNLSKNPTEKQITAYCETTYEKEYKNWKIAKTNTSLITKQIDLINDYISLEKYIIRMELKK